MDEAIKSEREAGGSSQVFVLTGAQHLVDETHVLGHELGRPPMARPSLLRALGSQASYYIYKPEYSSVEPTRGSKLQLIQEYARKVVKKSTDAMDPMPHREVQPLAAYGSLDPDHDRGLDRALGAPLLKYADTIAEQRTHMTDFPEIPFSALRDFKEQAPTGDLDREGAVPSGLARATLHSKDVILKILDLNKPGSTEELVVKEMQNLAILNAGGAGVPFYGITVIPDGRLALVHQKVAQGTQGKWASKGKQILALLKDWRPKVPAQLPAKVKKALTEL